MTIRDIAVALGVDVDNASVSKAENSIKGIKSLATKLLGSLAVVFTVSGVKSFISECTELASNVEQVQQKFDVVFDECAKGAEEWADSFSDAVGRNKNKIKEYMADNQNLLTGFGMTRDAATDMTEKMVEAALDLASFNNIEDDVAVNAMSKALMGESEAAKTLGAVLNDVTRAQAMEELGLKGKYEALDQATKMQVNYRAIMDQSQDSIGDCVRSMDSYESRARQNKAAIAELKEFLGSKLLPVMAIFVNWMTKCVKWLTAFAKKIIGATDEENRILKAFNAMHALVKKLQPAIERMMSAISNGITKARDLITKVVNRLGGVGNALKLLAIVAGAFLLVMNWSKIVAYAKSFATLLKIINKLFSVAGLKAMAAVAIIIILALIVEDFIQFLLGNDSVIGTIFEKAGISADDARQTIFEAWKKVVKFLSDVWSGIKTAALNTWNTIKNFFEKHSDSIKTNFMRAWNIIKTFLSGVWTFISQLVSTLFGDSEDDVNGSTNSTKDTIVDVWQKILDTVSAVLDALYEVFNAIFNAIATVTEFIFNKIKAFWDKWGPTVLSAFKKIFDNMKAAVNGFLEVIKGIANFITAVFQGDWSAAWDAVKQIAQGVWDTILNLISGAITAVSLVIATILDTIKTTWENIWNSISDFFSQLWDNIKTGITEKITGIKDTIMTGINEAVDWIKGLAGQASQWGHDMIDGLIQGIKDKIDGVKEAASNIAESIKSFLHFSVPDVGPLTDYQSWMPDFMQGLASGIDNNKNLVVDKIKKLSEGISAIANAGIAKPVTAMTSTVNNKSSSIVQNVDISNSYSGGSTETQKNVSKAMKKSATDATTYMARGLAYARG